MDALRAIVMMESAQELEDDFIPLEDFERIEKYRWNPNDPDEEKKRYDRHNSLTQLHDLLLQLCGDGKSEKVELRPCISF